MSHYLKETERVLADLIAFPTLSRRSNRELIQYVKRYFEQLDIEVSLDPHPDGKRFNLFATIGGTHKSGILLSAHTDTVPAEREDWHTDPFKLKKSNGRLYGRGSVDMKGFLALILAFASSFKAVEKKLKTPIHYALTFDEEEGTLGAAQIKSFLKREGIKPQIAIVGEPTGMLPYNGHKGGLEMITKVTGSSGHASDPRKKANAIYFAARLICFIEALSIELTKSPVPNSMFQPPYTTLSIGTIKGGEARNIIPNYCEFKWEIRPIAQDGRSLLKKIQNFTNKVLQPEMTALDEKSRIDLIEVAHCPSLRVTKDSLAASLIQKLWTNDEPSVLSFGTDGAHYQDYGIDTIIFGPGDMNVMHKPNEYIDISAIEDGISFMKNLLNYCQEN